MLTSSIDRTPQLIKENSVNDSELARKASQLVRDRKAQRIVLLDVKGRSDICDVQLICSAQSTRQAQSIAEGLESELRKDGVRPLVVEGKQTGNWILLDYGSLMVHVFFDELRDFYALENIWPDVKFLEV